MSDTEREKWDARYRIAAEEMPRPCQALVDFAHLLPPRGRALDLASGRGGNALALAQHGLDTSAWDISATAQEQLAAFARRRHLTLHTQVRDVTEQPPEADSFDVIVVSRFLSRPLCPHLAAALRPGGLLFYQTFTRSKLAGAAGPSNPEYLLAENELLRLFPDLQLLAYREEGQLGDTTRGLRNEAYLVAQRKSAHHF